MDKVTMVATVGNSPMPVLLSLWTQQKLAAERGYAVGELILVHSTGSQPVTERLRRLLTPSLFDKAGLPAPRIRLLDLGQDTSDINAILTRMTQDLPGSGEWPLLDYTGGTKAMCAAAVQWHLQVNDGAGEQARSYVDDIAGSVRFDDGSSKPARCPPSHLFPFKDMARLHGFRLVPQAEEATAKLSQSDRDAKEWEDMVRDAVGVVADRHNEDVEAGRCRACAAVGDVPVCQVFPAMKMFLGGADVGQFDVLVRWGHRVLSVEAKLGERGFSVRGAWAITRGRAAFGGATRNLFAQKYLLEGDLGSPYRLTLSDDAIDVRDIDSGWIDDPSLISFHDLLPPLAPPTEPAPVGTPPACPPGRGLFTAVGGSPTGPVMALAAAEPPPSWVQLITSAAVTDAHIMGLYKILAKDAQVRSAQSMDTGSAFAVGSYLTATISAASGHAEPVVLDSTAGNKAVTAAMVTAAFRLPRGAATVVCTDPRRRVRSTLNGPTSVLHSAPFAWPDLLGADWKVQSRPSGPIVDLITAAAPDTATSTLLGRDDWDIEGLAVAVTAVCAVDRAVCWAHLVLRPHRRREKPANRIVGAAVQIDALLATAAGDAISTIVTWDDGPGTPQPGTAAARTQVVRAGSGRTITMGALPPPPEPMSPELTAAITTAARAEFGTDR